VAPAGRGRTLPPVPARRPSSAPFAATSEACGARGAHPSRLRAPDVAGIRHASAAAHGRGAVAPARKRQRIAPPQQWHGSAAGRDLATQAPPSCPAHRDGRVASAWRCHCGVCGAADGGTHCARRSSSARLLPRPAVSWPPRPSSAGGTPRSGRPAGPPGDPARGGPLRPLRLARLVHHLVPFGLYCTEVDFRWNYLSP
jgi:hypothetical protein